MIWRVMPRNVWNNIVSWRTKRLSKYTKSQLSAMTTINVKKKKKWDPLENCQKYALKLFWNAYTCHVLEDNNILWSVNKLARSITKWTKACDKRLCRLISFFSSYMWIFVLPWYRLVGVAKTSSDESQRRKNRAVRKGKCPPHGTGMTALTYHCDKRQGYARIQDFCCSHEKITHQSFRETWCRNNTFVVLWHGRSREEMRGTILRTVEQNISTMIQSRNTMHWGPPVHGRRTWICWRIVWSLLTDCSEMSILGTVLVGLIFFGPRANLLVQLKNGWQRVANV